MFADACAALLPDPSHALPVGPCTISPIFFASAPVTPNLSHSQPSSNLVSTQPSAVSSQPNHHSLATQRNSSQLDLHTAHVLVQQAANSHENGVSQDHAASSHIAAQAALSHGAGYAAFSPLPRQAVLTHDAERAALSHQVDINNADQQQALLGGLAFHGVASQVMKEEGEGRGPRREFFALVGAGITSIGE